MRIRPLPGIARRAVALAAAIGIAAVLFSWTAAHTAENEQLARILLLKPNSSLADVGAGSGEVSLALAPRVPKGIVYSTEINPRLVDKIRDNASKAGARNVIPVLGRAYNTELPPNCCDAIYLRDVYHHLTDPLGMDRSLYQAMRPGGRLAILDFEPMPGTRPPPGVPADRGGHGIPERLVARELKDAGFQFLERMDWPSSRATRHYCVLFRKPSRITTPAHD